MKGYRILKTKGNRTHFVNDSEGIPMEWSTREEAMKWVEWFRANTKNGFNYTIDEVE